MAHSWSSGASLGNHAKCGLTGGGSKGCLAGEGYTTVLNSAMQARLRSTQANCLRDSMPKNADVHRAYSLDFQRNPSPGIFQSRTSASSRSPLWLSNRLRCRAGFQVLSGLLRDSLPVILCRVSINFQVPLGSLLFGGLRSLSACWYGAGSQ